MKKISKKQHRWELRQQKKMKRRFLKNRILKERKKRRKQTRKDKLPHNVRFESKQKYSKKFFKEKAPEKFSLIDNTDQLLKYFQSYDKSLLQGKLLKFDLKNISTLGFDALSLLLAKINDEKYTLNKVKGTLPENPQCRELFVKSGFLDHVFSLIQKKEQKGKMIGNYSDQNVVSECAKDVVKTVLSDRTSALSKNTYGTLIECMSNTNNHAKCKRWLTYYEENSIVKICFIDLGIGIVKHLNPKKKKGKDRIKNLFGLFDSRFTTPEVLLCELFKRNSELLDSVSSTGEPGRGMGLSFIRKCSVAKQIKKSILITNNIVADLKHDDYKRIKYDFKGTFYYWEIDKNVRDS